MTTSNASGEPQVTNSLPCVNGCGPMTYSLEKDNWVCFRCTSYTSGKHVGRPAPLPTHPTLTQQVQMLAAEIGRTPEPTPPTPAGTQGEDIIDIAYHSRCREIATSIGRTLKGSTLGAGFSTAEGNHIDEWTMNTIATLTARVRELEKSLAYERERIQPMHAATQRLVDDNIAALTARAESAERERDQLASRIHLIHASLSPAPGSDKEEQR